MKIIFYLFMIISCIFFYNSRIYGAEFNSKGVAELTGTLNNGKKVKIELKKEKISQNYPYKNAVIWGTIKGMPTDLIAEITIIEDHKNIFIPLSAYSDLGNLNNASLKIAGNAYHVIIEGGDAGGGYKAIISIEKGKIKQRQVDDLEFEGVIGEKTTYSFYSESN